MNSFLPTQSAVCEYVIFAYLVGKNLVIAGCLHKQKYTCTSSMSPAMHTGEKSFQQNMARGSYAHAILTEHFFPACTHLLLHTSGIFNCIAIEIVWEKKVYIQLQGTNFTISQKHLHTCTQLSILEEMDSAEMSIAFYTSLENEGWVSLVLVIPLLSFHTKMQP